MSKTLYVFASTKRPQLNLGNLGDIFGYHLLSHYAEPHNIKVIRVGINRLPPRCRNLTAAVGSIIQRFPPLVNSRKSLKITVLGCGLIKPFRRPQALHNPRLIYKGVRGPKTQKFLSGNPKIISDPGLLMPKLYPMDAMTAHKKIGYIIHGVDRKRFFTLFPEKKVDLVVDEHSTYETFKTKLSEYQGIVSSSLHGIIFSHAYGIPVAPIQVTHKITGGNFKFADYYGSLGHDFAGRCPVGPTTDFSSLIKNYWQPPETLIHNFQNIQEQELNEHLNSL